MPKEQQHVEEPELAAPTTRRFVNERKTGITATLFLAFSSLGIIYGDIGTSPLYVMNAIFPAAGPVPDKDDIIGAISAIIWAITIIPAIKYSLIALEFGTGAGEGGPFAIYTALYPPPEETDENRALTTYTTTSITTGRETSGWLQKKWIKNILFSWVLFGTCLTISDGLLTPAVSVVSAVGGLAIGAPSVSSSIVGISIALLAVLFIFQALGTRKVSLVFAPVVLVWVLTIGISGIINLTHYPGVFRAFDPSRAVMLFVRTGNFDLLSGVLLAITGVEAFFANLGQFSKNSIRLGFLALVYPCLIFAYLGQGAKLITDGEAVLPNVFFNSVPGGNGQGFWWFSWIIAVLAAFIASQAMITATFSLVQQLVRLHVMPAVKIIYTSDEMEGQIFVPAVNLLVMAGTIGLTAGFGTDAGLTNAYGFAVSGVLIVTTSILAVAMVELKHLPILVAVAFFLVAGFFDGLFWGSSLKKVPHGAWFPLGMACVLWILFRFYAWAKGLETKFDTTHRHRLDSLLSRSETEEDLDGQSFAKGSLQIEGSSVPVLRQRVPGTATVKLLGSAAALNRPPIFALFHNSTASTLNGAPHSFSAFLKAYPSLPQVIVFFNIRIVGIPHTTTEERYVVSKVRSFDSVYVATMRFGYRDAINLSDDLGEQLRDRIVMLESRALAEGECKEHVKKVDEALKTVTHIVPSYFVKAADKGGNRIYHYIRKFLIESIYHRVRVNFDDTDAYEFGEDGDVLRMGVVAAL